jgi:hypothetical protein
MEEMEETGERIDYRHTAPLEKIGKRRGTVEKGAEELRRPRAEGASSYV